MKKILVIGATSAIAQEAQKIWAGEGASLFLTGRKATHLEEVAADLRVRGAEEVHTHLLEVTDFTQQEATIREALRKLGGIDIALIAHGTLSPQKECEASVTKTLEGISVNYSSVVSLLTLLANYFEKEKRGSLAVISSVAGERGRRSNYVYGSAKGGVSLFLQGLRSRLSLAGVSVLTIKPGFVDTPMTAHLRKNFLFASPERVGRGIVQAIEKRKEVVYLPWFWRPVMAIVRGIPEKLFKKLPL